VRFARPVRRGVDVILTVDSDAPVVSIIVYANGQRTEMASMFPPQEAQHLVAFLRGLGLSSKFPRTTEKVHPEEVNLQTSNRQAP